MRLHCGSLAASAGPTTPPPRVHLTHAMQVDVLLLRNLGLAGPAFPPAWLAPGAMPKLATLVLEGNGGLVGTLPPDLAWPSLNEL